MKTNAPEKIYLEKIYPDNRVLPNGLNYNQSPNDIEYVRADAFIKKAENYLRNTCQRFILTEKDIEDFVKYMKGE